MGLLEESAEAMRVIGDEELHEYEAEYTKLQNAYTLVMENIEYFTQQQRVDLSFKAIPSKLDQ